jgi:hypothetical protein
MVMQPGGSSRPPLSEDLQKVAAGMGLDLSGIGVGGGTDVLDDPLVYMGAGREYRSDGDVLRHLGGKRSRTADRKVTITEANANFYKLTAEKVGQFQERAIRAGVLDPQKVQFGVHDDATYDAWVGLNERSAKFFSVGRKYTPDDVLDMIGQANPQTGGAGTGGGGFVDPMLDIAQRQRQTMLGFGTDLNQYKRSDPANVRVTAEEAFKKALGRKPRKAEMDRFVNTFMTQEKAAQKVGFDAADQLTGEARDRAMESASMVPVAAGGGATGSGSEADMLWNRLQRMIADAPGKITPGPRSRDRATQERLYARWKAGKGPRAAKPGTSKHGNGRANDLTYENDAVRAWALANAGKYGLAFPIYDPKLSRRMDESWHIELADSGGDSYGEAVPAASAGGPVTPAPISQNVTAQEVNLPAQAVEFARSQNPVETRAYDIGQQFNSFLAILQRGIGL